MFKNLKVEEIEDVIQTRSVLIQIKRWSNSNIFATWPNV